MSPQAKLIAGLGLLLGLSGCSITQSVQPVTDANIDRVCVETNPAVLMDGFEPTMCELIETHGMTTEVYSGQRPADCEHFLEYTANWRWDMAMYLSYADIQVYDREGLEGRATYDARNGGGRMDKFGPTRSKIEPLIEELFAGDLGDPSYAGGSDN